MCGTESSPSASASVLVLGIALLGGCTFDETSRWTTEPAPATDGCEVGTKRCRTALQRCEGDGDSTRWVTIDSCRRPA